jgi:integrase
VAEKKRKLVKTKIPGVYRCPPSRIYKDGAWLVRYRDTYGGTRMKTFRTRQEALDFKSAVRTDKRRGEFIDPQQARTPFTAVAETFMESRSAEGNKPLTPATLAGYRSALKTHLLPAFGDWPVSRIRATDIEAVLREAGIAAGTQQNVLRVMSPILNLAVREGMIRTNPCRFVELAAKPKKDQKFLTAAQVNQLAEEIGAGQNATLVYLAAYSGLRAGEIVALRKKHLTLGRIRITESVTTVNGKLHTGKPKNGKARSVSVPAFLRDLLAVQVANIGADDYVFTGKHGGPLRHGNFYNRVYRPAVERLVDGGEWPEELRELRFHDLRHTAASLLIARGLHPKAVCDHLGHSSINITMDRYGHLYPEAKDAIAAALDVTYSEAAQQATEILTADVQSI